MAERHRVATSSLNLRSEPVVRPGNRLAVLPEGQLVTKLAEAETAGWWRVGTTLAGSAVEGFVAARHLLPVDAAPGPAPARAIAAVHLAENRPDVRRDRDGGRAFPIGEPGRPPAPAGRDAQRRAGLLAIVDWLDVESGARWRPGAGLTFCNIYAYDVCYLAGVYLPRVWWTGRAVAELAQGRPVVPALGATIHELNANALCDWLEDFGPQFGWQRVFALDPLQEAADAGRLALIVAQRVDLNRSGHIQIVAPEHDAFAARRSDVGVTLPLQSQAGARNFRYGFLGTTRWWTGSQFRTHGLWVRP
jgi:hypothetical protein